MTILATWIFTKCSQTPGAEGTWCELKWCTEKPLIAGVVHAIQWASVEQGEERSWDHTGLRSKRVADSSLMP